MSPYNYYEEVSKSIREYLENHWEKNKPIPFDERITLHDEMFISDQVTGNASGSFTFNAHEAEECVHYNMELLREAVKEFGIDGDTLIDNMTSGEWMDVTIRCYVLGEVEGDVFDEWNKRVEEEYGIVVED